MKVRYQLFHPAFVGFILLSLLMAANPVRALEPVTLQMRWLHQFQFAGYYAAQEKGFYREAGLDVTLKEGFPGADPVTEVITGRAEFGIGLSSLVVDYLKGKPVLMLGPVFQHSPNVLIVRGRDRRPVDLAGRGQIALMEGDQDVELKAMFINEGITLDRLRIVPDVRHLDDFLDGQVEALNGYISNEPYTLNQLGIPHTVLKPQTYGMDFYGDVLFTGQEFEKRKPEIVAAFRAASLRGWKYALDHPDELIDLILARYNTQGKSREQLAYEARELSRLINHEVIDLGHSNPGRWRHIADTYAGFGLVPADMPLNDFFYRGDKNADHRWLYSILAMVAGILFVVSAIAVFIHRINRRLKVAVEESARSEARHRVIFQTSPSAGVVWREGFIVADWNQQAEQLFGWRREEVVGRPFPDFLLPDAERERMLSSFSSIPQGDGLRYCVNTNLTRDGRTITCEWFNAVLPERPGDPREVVSLANDITYRKHQEAEIAELNRSLAQRALEADAANQAKSAFLANMSHEIRTPLNAITGVAHILRRSGLTIDQGQALDKLEIASSHLLQIISDVLDLSKIEAGKFVLEDVPVHIETLLANVAGILEQKAREKGITFRIEVEAIPHNLRGDPTRLQQAILNFAGNAVKFTDHGHVLLRANVVSETQAAVTVRFEVEDTGVGIAADAIPRLFGAFEQADNSTTRRYGGTGLGLAISKKFAEAMNGTAGVSSVEGKGSTFWFSAELVKGEPPADEDINASTENSERAIKENYSGKRVLLADDEPFNQTIAQMMLEDVGLVVDLADDGRQAVSLACAAEYDLILMDMQMPDIDGLEATRQIRQISKCADKPVIAMTANAFAEDKVRCLEAGMNDFITKPVTSSMLYDTLFKWLKKTDSRLSGCE